MDLCEKDEGWKDLGIRQGKELISLKEELAKSAERGQRLESKINDLNSLLRNAKERELRTSGEAEALMEVVEKLIHKLGRKDD